MKPDTTLDDIEGLMNARFTGEVWGIFQGLEMVIAHMLDGNIVTHKVYYDHKFSNKLDALIDD